MKKEEIEARHKRLAASATVLVDTTLSVHGLTIHGSPWSMGFCPDNKWRLVPDNVDVLLTHGPPELHCPRGAACPQVDLLYQRIEPKLHCFGHVHSQYGLKYHPKKKTLLVNAATTDVNKPIVIDIYPNKRDVG